eukprot:m.200620 g.200620  ORF g.200620 m.200620 type:complete len:862 (+) comp25210_c0_seq1:118-2703(+)
MDGSVGILPSVTQSPLLGGNVGVYKARLASRRVQHRRPPTLARFNRASSNSSATSTATVSEMIAETGAPTSQANRETQRAAVANQLALMVAGRTHSPPKASAGLTDSWQPPGAVPSRGPMVGLVHGHEKNRLRQQSAQKRRPPTAAGLKHQRHTPKAAEGIADFFQTVLDVDGPPQYSFSRSPGSGVTPVTLSELGVQIDTVEVDCLSEPHAVVEDAIDTVEVECLSEPHVVVEDALCYTLPAHVEVQPEMATSTIEKVSSPRSASADETTRSKSASLTSISSDEGDEGSPRPRRKSKLSRQDSMDAQRHSDEILAQIEVAVKADAVLQFTLEYAKRQHSGSEDDSNDIAAIGLNRSEEIRLRSKLLNESMLADYGMPPTTPSPVKGHAPGLHGDHRHTDAAAAGSDVATSGVVSKAVTRAHEVKGLIQKCRESSRSSVSSPPADAAVFSRSETRCVRPAPFDCDGLHTGPNNAKPTESVVVAPSRPRPVRSSASSKPATAPKPVVSVVGDLRRPKAKRTAPTVDKSSAKAIGASRRKSSSTPRAASSNVSSSRTNACTSGGPVPPSKRTPTPKRTTKALPKGHAPRPVRKSTPPAPKKGARTAIVPTTTSRREVSSIPAPRQTKIAMPKRRISTDDTSKKKAAQHVARTTVVAKKPTVTSRGTAQPIRKGAGQRSADRKIPVVEPSHDVVSKDARAIADLKGRLSRVELDRRPALSRVATAEVVLDSGQPTRVGSIKANFEAIAIAQHQPIERAGPQPHASPLPPTDDVPLWKRELSERKRRKRASLKTTDKVPSAALPTANVPAWKIEWDRKRNTKLAMQACPATVTSTRPTSIEIEPEWQRLARSNRERNSQRKPHAV